MSAAIAGATIAAPIIGGIIGNQQARADQEAARRLQEQAMARLDGLVLPEYEQLGTLPFENYDNISDFLSAKDSAVSLDPSQMAGISLDPATRQAQMSALSELAELSQGGMRAQDEVALSAVQDSVGQRQRGARDAITQNMQQRGMSGSGLELMAQMSNQQAGASEANRAGMERAAMAQQAALQALADRANLAGNMRSQDFGQQTDVARAQDAISQWNAANRQNVGTANTNRMNDDQMRNQALRQQQIDKRNTNMTANQWDRTQANNDVRNMSFGNAFSKASGQANAYQDMASGRMADAQNTRNMYQNVGSGVGQGAAAYGNYDEHEKDRDLNREIANKRWGG